MYQNSLLDCAVPKPNTFLLDWTDFGSYFGFCLFVCLFVYFFVRPTICFLSNFVISKLFLLISWHA